jgi:lysozyme
MRLTKQGIDLLHHFEGCKLTAYQCSAKVWTIGWGNTFYEDKTPVKQGDTITQDRADELFLNVVTKFSKGVSGLIQQPIAENKFSALVSFAYNVGLGNLQKSTLLRMVNANPNDAGISEQFLRWNKAGGKELAGLTRRRQAEADLYFDE